MYIYTHICIYIYTYTMFYTYTCVHLAHPSILKSQLYSHFIKIVWGADFLESQRS